MAALKTARILVVDDEESVTSVLRIVLQGSGYEVQTANTEAEARRLFEAEAPDLVLQDMRLSHATSGIQLLEHFRKLRPKVPVIVITAYSNWDSTLEAMQEGAYDFIKKPFDNEAIREVVARALAHREQVDRGMVTSGPKRSAANTEILGNSPQVREVLSIIKRIATTDSTVLVTGESGTGKELVARALHYCSSRADQPFVSVNSGAFPEALLESELFGHVRGAFSGALHDKKGLIEVADGGTFFLDEVGDLPLEMQVKLLRVIDEQRFFPVGGTQARQVNVRFIGATNKTLLDEVTAGRFREDLYYRLNVIPIELPPLRERRGDIELLAAHFLARSSEKMGRPITRISDEARAQLRDYHWPGNVRELQNTIERSVALSTGEVLERVLIQARASSRPAPSAAPTEARIGDEGIDLEAVLAEIERGYIREALKQTNGHLTNAARILGISFRSLRYKVQKLDIKTRPED